MNSVLERVYEIGIIPVIAFNSVDEAIPLCKALMDGACRLLRSPSAPHVLKSASRRFTKNCPICCWVPALC